MTVTPVLADQLEDAGRGASGCWSSCASTGSARPSADARDVEPALPRRLRGRGRPLPAPRSSGSSALGGDPLAPFADAAERAGRAVASAATHAVLPLLATREGRRLQLDAGLRSHRRRFGRARGVLASRVRLRARARACSPSSASSTSAPTSPRTSRPPRRCARSRPTPARSPSRSTGRRSAGCGRWTATPRIPATPTSTASRCAAAGPGRSAASPTTPPPAADRAPASRGGSSPPPSPRGCGAYREATGRRGLLTFAIDTELLGHWWWEGPAWLEAALAALPAAGVRPLTLADAPASTSRKRGRSRRRPGVRARTCGPGTRRRSRISPGGRGGRAAAAPGGIGGRPPRAGAERAARELIALQSSDWAFLDYGRQAGDYPFQRALGHSRALFEAIESARRRPNRDAQPRARPDPGAAARALSQSPPST